jgi:hypothetical protein
MAEWAERQMTRELCAIGRFRRVSRVLYTCPYSCASTDGLADFVGAESCAADDNAHFSAYFTLDMEADSAILLWRMLSAKSWRIASRRE